MCPSTHCIREEEGGSGGEHLIKDLKRQDKKRGFIKPLTELGGSTDFWSGQTYRDPGRFSEPFEPFEWDRNT